jgi:hypothetical protein
MPVPPVPHDPALRACLTYTWRDEQYYLIIEPSVVCLRSNSTSINTPHPTAAAAERAYWTAIVASIIGARGPRDPYVAWPGVELAVVVDPVTRTPHVAERVRGVRQARPLASNEPALEIFFTRLLSLIPGTAGDHR